MKFVEFPHQDTFDYQAERTCRNCDYIFNGRYCNRCGERVILHEDRSLLPRLKTIFNAIPILDNKLTRTLRLMITRTGFVSSCIIQGRTVPFVNPLAIFLLINLGYFLFPSYQTFNSPLKTHMNFLLHKEDATAMVERRLQSERVSLQNFTARYDQHAMNVAKIMLISFAFIMALPFMMVNVGSPFFFRDHLTVSLEFCSVVVLVNNLIVPWIWLSVMPLFSYAVADADLVLDNVYFKVLTGLLTSGLLFLIQKRVYGNETRRALFLSSLCVLGFFLALHIYYGVVFFISMWTL
jgi:hypothetical protein